MENMAIPQMISPMSPMLGQVAQAGGLGALLGGGDVFAQLLQMMLQGQDGSQMLGQMQKDEQDEGTDLAAQMMAELFGMPPALLPADLSDLQMGGQQEQLVASGTATQQLIAVLQQGTQGQPQAAQGLPQLPTSPLTPAQQPQTTEAEIQVLEATQTGGEESEAQSSLLGGQSQFRSSVMEAQKLLRSARSGADQQSDKQEFTIEQLQSQVDAGRFRAEAPAEKTIDKLPSPQELLSQVKTGITENLTKGKNEFVVKLKPDGLGEITVKMVENSGKIALSIVTSNSQVAKLLTGELAGLREALRPYNAEVREVVTQSESSQTAAQDGQFGQHFADHHHQQFSGRDDGPAYGYGGFEEDHSPAEAPALASLASELDTYI